MTKPSRQERREVRSRSAVMAATALAREHGVSVQKPTVLNDLFSLMVHLQPAPVVARVATSMPKLRTPITDWLQREIEVTRFLAKQGVPVVEPSGNLPSGPHIHDGFAISFWEFVQSDPDRTPTVDDRAAMLPDLHAALRRYPGELPLLGEGDIDRGLEILDRTEDVVSESDARKLHASADRLRSIWVSPTDTIQPYTATLTPAT